MSHVPGVRIMDQPVGHTHRVMVRTALRVVAALALVGGGALLWMEQFGYRGWEAWAAGHVTQAIGGGAVLVNRGQAAFYVGIYDPTVFGLTVTPECTSAIVTIGLLGVTALLVMTTRLSLTRLATAVFAAAAVFFVLNLLRLVGIALATKEWGTDTGFHYSHVWAGTFVTVFGGVAVCVLYMMLLGVRNHRRIAS